MPEEIKPPSFAEIARRLGVSPQRVTKLIKDGMPTSSVADAIEWRENRPERANRKFAVEHEEGNEPLDAEWATVGKKIERKTPASTGDSLADALSNAITVSEQAFLAVDKAICSGRTAGLSPLLAVHNKALEARFMAEKAYREEMERRGLLVDKSAITEVCRRAIDSVLRRLKKLPNERGPDCNPENPLIAVKLLEEEINSIIAIGREAMKALE